jgi:ribosome-associated toxin RatA of RatAB toxin-antitoxin module
LAWSTTYTPDGELFELALPKFSLEKIVNAKRDSVHEILSNYENYEKLLPQFFPSVRIRSVRENISVVAEHMNLGDQELIIMAKHVTKEPVLHEIFVIGGDIKGSYIKQQFLDLSEKTKIIVDVDFKLKGKMKISSLFGKNKFQQAYEEILDAFTKIAEN